MVGTVKLSLSTMSNFLRPAMLGGTNRPYKLFFMHWSEDDMKTLTGLMAEGKLKVPVDSKYPSDKQGVLAAYEKLMSNKVSVGRADLVHDI
jgi:NADPH:quinone reductase-like Zn-dependent oxidoreductase